MAAIDAFFAWTEHVFIHLAILQGRITTGAEVGEVVAAEWGEKFKVAFDLGDRQVKRRFDELTVIRRQLRNFMAHGAFGKEGAAFRFHSKAGAVPVALEYGERTRRFSLTPELGFDDAAAIASIEAFIGLMWSGPREAARIYIQESELPLILTMAQDGTYARAMASPDAMNKFAEGLSQYFDQAANMDW